MEECCVVCAAPLQWAAVGPCGHCDVCSNCALRLRFVLNNTKCCVCQQDCPAVLVTRHVGEFTDRPSAAAFEQFPAQAQSGSLQFCEPASAYFDDTAHFEEMQRLTTLTCSICSAEPSGKQHTFDTLASLRSHLKNHHNKHLCGICLESRKVFVAEQQVYSKADLDRHITCGCAEADTCNELGASGFKGHPECRFCRRRFYGEGELYTHMQRVHLSCHICEREDPTKYQYYQDYPALLEHFRAAHFVCEDAECLANKFIVFQTPAHLKRHLAKDHGGRTTTRTPPQHLQPQSLSIPSTGLRFDYTAPPTRPSRQRPAQPSAQDSPGPSRTDASPPAADSAPPVPQMDEFPSPGGDTGACNTRRLQGISGAWVAAAASLRQGSCARMSRRMRQSDSVAVDASRGGWERRLDTFPTLPTAVRAGGGSCSHARQDKRREARQRPAAAPLCRTSSGRLVMNTANRSIPPC